MKVALKFLVAIPAIVFTSCAFKTVSRSKDIIYGASTPLKLDVYAPGKHKSPANVIVFFHGGNWNSGKKSTYSFWGNRMARKGVVLVVVDYRLSPLTDYKGMASDAASAVKWVKTNISRYGGNEDKIFLAGHSAGGHIAALLSTDSQYFEAINMRNPIHGTILIDAFGLDMYSFLKNPATKKSGTYYDMFSKDPEIWKTGSPFYHIHEGMRPFILFTGGKTYPVITQSNEAFVKSLRAFQPNTKLLVVPRRKHVGMMTQFLYTGAKTYDDILEFMKP